MSIMMNELLTAPDVVRRVISVNKSVVRDIAKEFADRGLTNITTVSRGSSDNAATCFKYMSEIIAGVMVSKYTPSITTVYNQSVNLSSNMLVAVSQSGQSIDTMMVVNDAKAKGVLTVAVTNDAESPLAKTCDYHLYLAAEDEKSVAATKTFTAQVTALYLLANAIADNKAAKIMNIGEIPPMFEAFVKNYDSVIRDFATETKDINNCVVLTRGLLQGVASEISLKLMETCNIFNRPFSTAEFMHGPLALIEEGTNVIVLAPGGESTSEFIDMTTRLSLLGANIIAFSDIKEVIDIADRAVAMPTVHSLAAPFIYTLAIQMYAANMADVLGKDPDAPRNLKKVTITK